MAYKFATKIIERWGLLLAAAGVFVLVYGVASVVIALSGEPFNLPTVVVALLVIAGLVLLYVLYLAAVVALISIVAAACHDPNDPA